MIYDSTFYYRVYFIEHDEYEDFTISANDDDMALEKLDKRVMEYGMLYYDDIYPNYEYKLIDVR